MWFERCRWFASWTESNFWVSSARCSLQPRLSPPVSGLHLRRHTSWPLLLLPRHCCSARHAQLLTSNLHYLMARRRHPAHISSLSSSQHALQHNTGRCSFSGLLFQASSVCLSVSIPLSIAPLFSPPSSGDSKCIRIRGSLPVSWPSFRLGSSQVQLPRSQTHIRGQHFPEGIFTKPAIIHSRMKTSLHIH